MAREVVTLLEVAEAAGVSKTTASNVFSAPERVRPALRERVLDAARQLGYAGPDPRGRLLSSGKVNAIGAVAVGNFGLTLFFTHEYQTGFLGGVAHVCEQRGIGLTLVSGRDDSWTANDAIVDGLIFDGAEGVSRLEPARRRRMPIVVHTDIPMPGCSTVGTDSRAGGYEMARHLLDLGHRKFLIACAMTDFRPPIYHPPTGKPRRFVAAGLSALERMAGIAIALEEHGLSFDDMPVIEACGTAEEEAAFGNGAAMALDMALDVTAMIGLNDGIALAIVRHARIRGLSIPRDLSVVGFNDIPAAAVSDPPLTTMHQSAFEAGKTAAELLLDGGPPRHVVLPVKFVLRGSTAPPRRRKSKAG